MDKLTAEDKRVIDEFSEEFEAGLDALEKAKQLNVGDFLILYLERNGKMELQCNSYGAPVKYKVVHTTRHGIPFVKKISKKGNPIGDIYSCTGTLDSDTFRYGGQKFQFELNKVPYDLDSLTKYFATLKVGDRLWTSNNRHLVVENVRSISRRALKQAIADGTLTINTPESWYGTKIKTPLIVVLTVRNHKGKVSDITPDYFFYKALYKDRPRTYRELKI